MMRIESCAIALALSGCFHTQTSQDAFRANVVFALLGAGLTALGAWSAHATWENPDAEPPDLIPSEVLMHVGVGIALGGLIGMAVSYDNSTPAPRPAGAP